MTRRTLYILASIYFIIVTGFIIFPPTVKLINKVDPYILGFPCFQFFILLISFLIGIGLMMMYWLEDKIDHREEQDIGGDYNA